MDIRFKTNKLEKSVESPRAIQKNYGTRAKLVNQRKTELEAAITLEAIRFIPAAHCHELSGDRKGQLSIDISGNHRIIFEPDHELIPKKEDGGLDWKMITKILIIDIGIDYH